VRPIRLVGTTTVVLIHRYCRVLSAIWYLIPDFIFVVTSRRAEE